MKYSWPINPDVNLVFLIQIFNNFICIVIFLINPHFIIRNIVMKDDILYSAEHNIIVKDSVIKKHSIHFKHNVQLNPVLIKNWVKLKL